MRQTPVTGPVLATAWRRSAAAILYISTLALTFAARKIWKRRDLNSRSLGTIHAYPTLTEANKCAPAARKRAHAPENGLKWAQHYHAWMRESA